MTSAFSFKKVLGNMGEMSPTRVLVIMAVSTLCLGITVQAEDDDRSCSIAPVPSRSDQLPTSPINTKVNDELIVA